MSDEKVRKSDLFPVGSLEGRRNYKRYFYIRKDGSILDRIHLDVSDQSHREQLVCYHYLIHLTRYFLQSDIGVSDLGRDAPWDFSLKLSSGEAFSVEITSIAENQRLFEVNKAEERFKRWIGQEYIPLHELSKLAALFPVGDLEHVALDQQAQGLGQSDLVVNPLFEGGPPLFLSHIPEPTETLSQLVQTAIEKKAAKAHGGKEDVVLIIDNRTATYEIDDYRIATETLKDFLADVPFPEVWFYTGYYSDDDGNRAEFSFAPFKLRASQEEVLRTLEVDSKGRHIW
jgi:hypothetical protein